MIEKSERQFDKHVYGYNLKGGYHMISALYGVFAAQRVNAALYDKLHQAQRRSFGLPERSLQEYQGILSRDRVIASFYDIHNAILQRRAHNEQRDLKVFTFWLLVGAFLTGTAAALL